MSTVCQDLWYSIRALRRSPGFAAIAIITLALGIGANTALFSVVNGVLLNPLPYPHAEQLAAVYAKTPGFDRSSVVYLNFLDWQRDARTFSSMAIYRNQDYNVTGRAEAERVSGLMVSADFFSTFGVNPVLGRAFRQEDDRLGAAPVAILGGGFWSREFGSSPDVVGKSLVLNGTSYTVAGVIPASFQLYGHDRDVYTPIGQWGDASFRDRRISVSAHAVSRLKPGVTLAQANADMDVVVRHLAEAFPVANQNSGITVVGMKEDMVGKVQPYLVVLVAAVGFLLLIACANVANLLIARSTGRSREFALRAALGAGRMRVVRQLLTESLVLGACGGAMGLALGAFGMQAAVTSLAGTLPRVENVALDERVLAFSLLLSLGAVVVFGLSPAIKTSHADLQVVLRSGGRGSSGARHRLQGIFVAVEIAMALVLLIGAGLMLRSLSALWRVDPGYNPHHAVAFNLSTPSSSATTSAETRARLRQFNDRMRAIPGVQSFSVTLGSRPMVHDSSLPFWVEGQPKPANDNEMPQAMFYLVEAGFQNAMGIRLERGRFITQRDNENAPVMIDIDDVFARTYFLNENPIGKHVHLLQFNVEAEIVGVVGHIQQWGPGGDAKGAIEAQFFYPFMQIPEKVMPLAAGGVSVVLRTAEDSAAIMELVRRAVRQMDARQAIYGVQTMDEVIVGALAPRRISMMLLGAFAALALALSCVGIYGVASYVAGQRTHEIGVRVALGAQHADVMRLVLGQGAKMALAGVAVGIAGALVLTRFIANELFGVTAHDPLTFAGVAILLTTVALLACYIPAQRAARVDPAIALRCE
jgi:predicted permease